MFRFLGTIFGALLKIIYDLLHTIGSEPESISYFSLAIILATIVVKVIILPLNLKSARAMKKTQELQPQAEEIRIKFKHDPQQMNAKIAKLYKENNASLTGGCLPMLLTIPIIFGFFAVIQNPTQYAFTEEAFATMQKNFLWIKDLTQPDPYWYAMPLIVGILTYLQTLTTPTNPTVEGNNSMQVMNLMMPLMIFWFSLKYAGGLSLYWATSTLFTIIQSIISNKEIFMKNVNNLLNR